ncbi:MAG: hypothetical protein JWM99_4300 [Verrucomicrobiales bacterium]|nr:hypothetical protein [Verrucomicrobiales bacterium]
MIRNRFPSSTLATMTYYKDANDRFSMFHPVAQLVAAGFGRVDQDVRIENHLTRGSALTDPFECPFARSQDR